MPAHQIRTLMTKPILPCMGFRLVHHGLDLPQVKLCICISTASGGEQYRLRERPELHGDQRSVNLGQRLLAIDPPSTYL
jgi:hypothetical protein